MSHQPENFGAHATTGTTGVPSGAGLSTTLTLAQAKAGLIEAAKAGLIDGSELTESWFLSLKRDVYLMRKKSQAKAKSPKTPKEQVQKEKKEKKEPITKKISPVITGLTKFVMEHQAQLHVAASDIEKLKQFKTVTELTDSFQSDLSSLANKCLKFAMRNLHVLDENEQIDQEALKNYTQTWDSLDLTEEEKKSTRTWFPRFFQKKKGPNDGPASSGVSQEKPTGDGAKNK